MIQQQYLVPAGEYGTRNHNIPGIYHEPGIIYWKKTLVFRSIDVVPAEAFSWNPPLRVLCSYSPVRPGQGGVGCLGGRAVGG